MIVIIFANCWIFSPTEALCTLVPDSSCYSLPRPATSLQHSPPSTSTPSMAALCPPLFRWTETVAQQRRAGSSTLQCAYEVCRQTHWNSYCQIPRPLCLRDSGIIHTSWFSLTELLQWRRKQLQRIPMFCICSSLGVNGQCLIVRLRCTAVATANEETLSVSLGLSGSLPQSKAWLYACKEDW